MFKECLSYSFLVLQTKLVIYLFTYLLKRLVHHFKDRTPLKVSIYLNTAFQSFHTQFTDLGKKIVNWTFQKMLIKQRISMINYQTRPVVYFYRCNILIHPQKTSRKSRCVTPHICWRMCVPPHGASSDGGGSPYITALLLCCVKHASETGTLDILYSAIYFQIDWKLEFSGMQSRTFGKYKWNTYRVVPSGPLKHWLPYRASTLKNSNNQNKLRILPNKSTTDLQE